MGIFFKFIRQFAVIYPSGIRQVRLEAVRVHCRDIHYDNLPRATDAELLQSYRQSDAVLYRELLENLA
ncbi:MAG TPA: hypothetical protein VG146_19975 [Verrucomicrobiae bacterium]|nr:hypothetical protein [Verrucomicrobiae bacterium]